MRPGPSTEALADDGEQPIIRSDLGRPVHQQRWQTRRGPDPALERHSVPFLLVVAGGIDGDALGFHLHAADEPVIDVTDHQGVRGVVLAG